jgi:hypothetical protein
MGIKTARTKVKTCARMHELRMQARWLVVCWQNGGGWSRYRLTTSNQEK